MLTEYGHARITWNEIDYNLTPSFSNIAKIGKPREIIDLFKLFVSLDASVSKWHIAMQVLDACCDKEMPPSLIGYTQFSNKKQRFVYVHPAHGMPIFHNCIVLAEHCLKHGVCGVYDSGDDPGESTESIDEFDAYWFIEMAMEHLNVSRDDAATMTMTEFARRMSIKFPSKKKKSKPVIDEFEKMLAWAEKKDKKEAH